VEYGYFSTEKFLVLGSSASQASTHRLPFAFLNLKVSFSHIYGDFLKKLAFFTGYGIIVKDK
jgi:hypothetical protein